MSRVPATTFHDEPMPKPTPEEIALGAARGIFTNAMRRLDQLTEEHRIGRKAAKEVRAILIEALAPYEIAAYTREKDAHDTPGTQLAQDTPHAG